MSKIAAFDYFVLYATDVDEDREEREIFWHPDPLDFLFNFVLVAGLRSCFVLKIGIDRAKALVLASL